MFSPCWPSHSIHFLLNPCLRPHLVVLPVAIPHGFPRRPLPIHYVLDGHHRVRRGPGVDALFPDRRDYAILTPLPLKAGTIFSAKITALLLFLSLFIVDVGGVPAFFYPFVETMGIRGFHVSLLRLCGMIAAHAIAIFAASAFSFLLFVALQGLLVNVFSPRAFKKVSLYTQVLAMVTLLLLLFLLPIISTLLPKWQQARSPQLFWLPPLWFLGLYQTLLGSEDAVFHALAWVSVVALVMVAIFCAAGYVLNYKRHMQRALEASTADPAGPSWLAGAAMRLINQLVLRKPRERAIFFFVVRTITRSAKHRLYFAAYVGTGLALALFGILEALVHSTHGNFIVVITRPHEALLAIPLIISFFLLSGMRMVFTIPAELRANWIFQLAEDENRVECLAGARKAMVVPVVLTLALLFPIYLALWGWPPAIMHLVFSLMLSLILVESLLLNFRKIPLHALFSQERLTLLCSACSTGPPLRRTHTPWPLLSGGCSKMAPGGLLFRLWRSLHSGDLLGGETRRWRGGLASSSKMRQARKCKRWASALKSGTLAANYEHSIHGGYQKTL